jgi:hypothetical protein
MASLTAIFSIDVVGEVSQEQFKGSFTTKLRLSHADTFRKDEIRRKLLGPNPEGASPRAQNSADIFSELAVHILDAPSWWTSANNGIDLADDAPVAAVFEGAVAEKKKYLDGIKDKATAAAAELKKDVSVVK